MNIRAFLILALGLFLLNPQSIQAQNSIAKIKSEADSYFRDGDYRQALNYYVRYNQYKSGVPAVIKRMAICQINNNQVDKAQANLSMLIENGEASNDSEIYYFYGECLMHSHDFNTAAKSYKQFIRKTKSGQRYEEVLHKLKNCASGSDLIHTKPIGFLENFGPIVNSIEDDINPLYSANFNDKIYYTSNFDRDEANPLNAKKSFDIYSTELRSGEWADPSLFPKKFSTNQDEIPLSFFNNGQVMYFQRGRFNDARILVDTFSTDTSALNTIDGFAKSDAPIFMELGDQNMHNYGDSIVFFSSRRPGGFGGYDLYYSLKKSFGWTAPMNMGPRINTQFDEVDPFMTDNGTSIYFSSNREASIGGFDIFTARYDAASKNWGYTKNVGLPINSSGNDRGIQLSSNGSSVIFSSDRKTGYGGFDLYIMYAENPLGDMNVIRGQLIPGFLMTDEAMLKNANEIVEEEIPISNEPAKIVEFEEIETIEEIVDETIYPKKKITIASIYYSENDVVLNPQSTRELDKLADLLRIYPKLSVRLLSHASGYEGPEYFDLYFSARRAEQIINYLDEKGIDKSSISIMGLGDQFPYARNIINGQIAGYSTKLNRRIEMIILGGSKYNLSFSYIDGGLGEEYIDDRQKTLRDLLTKVSFKVQVKEASQVYKDDVLENNSFATIEKYPTNNSYQYTVGWSSSYTEMDRLARKLREQAYDQAKVVAYHLGTRIDDNTARKLAIKNEELKKYLMNK